MDDQSKVILIIFVLLLSVVGSHKNKNFILISGYPQSGTSLIASIIGSLNCVTTMFKNCIVKYGEKRCKSFNYEGQWMLDLGTNNFYNNSKYLTNKDVIKDYGPGKLCVKDGSSTSVSPSSLISTTNTQVKKYIRYSWDYYWNNTSTINSCSSEFFFLHKSPADMVKLPFLVDLFQQPSDRIKIIIVMKHPVSSNRATLDRQGWISEYDHSKKKFLSLSGGEEQKIHIKKNMNHFFQYLNKNSSDVNACGQDLGWLPAHKIALNQILTITSGIKKSTVNKNTNGNMIDDNNRIIYKNIDIHLLHSEDLEYPRSLCRRLVRFIYKHVNTASLSKIEQNYIKNACIKIGFKQVSTINKIDAKRNSLNIDGGSGISRSSISNHGISGQFRTSKQNILHNNKKSTRYLREHLYDDSTSTNNKFNYDEKHPPVIIREVINRSKERLKDFEKALKEYTEGTIDEIDSTKDKINKIEEELQQFGYSLYKPFVIDSSIMERYG